MKSHLAAISKFNSLQEFNNKKEETTKIYSRMQIVHEHKTLKTTEKKYNKIPVKNHKNNLSRLFVLDKLITEIINKKKY